MVDLARVGERLYDGFQKLFSQYMQFTLRMNPITNLATDIFGFGYNGGPIEGHKIKELVLKDGKIWFFRNYNPDKGETPMQASDMVFDARGTYRGTGKALRVPPTEREFDEDFAAYGSAARLTNDDFMDAEDKSVLVQEFMTDALRYYVRRGHRRHLGTYTDPATGTTSNIEAVDIQTAPRSFFEKFDPRGFDPELSFFHIAQTAVYTAFDKLLFDPYIEKPIKAFNNWVQSKFGKDAPKIRLDTFISSQYVTLSEITNAAYDLPSIGELYAQAA